MNVNIHYHFHYPPSPGGPPHLVQAYASSHPEWLQERKRKREKANVEENAFDLMMKRQKTRHKLEDNPSNNPLTWAIIYEWLLDNEEFVSRDHPLFGISYIGQVVRGGLLPHQAFEVRTNDHITGANRKDKDLGFHCVLKQFGARAFSRRILEKIELPRTEAMEWADEREKHHIAERGGVLQDMEERLEQTLNLTSGGQGDPAGKWEAIQALSARRWHEFQRKYQAYFDRKGDGRVPTYHVEDGYRLGQAVASIRTQKHFVDGSPERMQWLKSRGWVDNEIDAKWEDFKAAYQSYYDREGDGRMLQDHVEVGYPLGIAVSNIRSQNRFVKGRPERMQWLRKRGWVDNEYDAKWEDFKAAYQSYYDRKRDGRVPTDHVESGYPLGQTVSSIRTLKYFVDGRPERMKWLKDRGWVECERDAQWEDFQAAYQSYYDRRRDGRVPRHHVESGYPLGQTVVNIRMKLSHVKGKRDRLQWLKDRRFMMHCRTPNLNKLRWDAAWATCPSASAFEEVNDEEEQM